MNVDKVLSNQNVFLTGASGFIGSAMLYRLLQLLRRNPESLHTVYVLLRKSSKYGSVFARLREEVLANDLFNEFSDDMESLIGKRVECVIPIEGDITKELMGVSEDQRRLIASHSLPTVFVHCAADTQFQGHFNHAMKLNALGTLQCIRLANAVKASGFVHVSTLYVNSREDCDARVMEKLYDQGFDRCQVFEDYLSSGLQLSEERITEIMQSQRKNGVDVDLVGQNRQWPNTYTVTKNIAECVARKYCAQMGIPLGITRLGIVSPINKGPHCGWFIGTGGFIFVAIGCATGHIRWLPGTGKGRPDLAPVDFTIDAMMAVTARVVSAPKDFCRIYQLGVADGENDEFNIGRTFIKTRRELDVANLPNVSMDAYLRGWISNPFLYFLYETFVFDLPLLLATPLGWLISLLMALEGVFSAKVTAQMGKFQRKLNFQRRARLKMKVFAENYFFFLEQRWRFDTTHVRELFASLDARSQQLFDFDVNQFSQDDYTARVVIAVMRRWHEHKQRKKKQAAAVESKDKHTSQSGVRKPTDWKRIIKVVKSLGVNFGGIGMESSVPFPFAISLVLSLSLFGLFAWIA